MSAFHIGEQRVGPDEPTFIIAEAGSNHNGDIEIAKELIDVAADAGADAVKFQTFRAENLYVDNRDQVGNHEESTYELLESLEQPYEWIPELYEYCRSRDVQFLSSAFDKQSAQELVEYVPAFKIASFTISHHPFLADIAETGKPVIMSTGAHTKTEVASAVEVLRANGVEDIALLHCVSSYPTPLEEINVRAIETLNSEFDTVVGFSDHTTEPTVAPAAAVALGASVVEKHITLDKEMDGPDHSFALEPGGLEKMVDTIRQTETALGDGTITLREVESESANRGRRSIFAAGDIASGDIVQDESVQILRPGTVDAEGARPEYLDDIVGSRAVTDIKEGDPIRLAHVDTDTE